MAVCPALAAACMERERSGAPAADPTHESLIHKLRFRFRTVAQQFLACCRQLHMPALRCSRPTFHSFS